MPSHVHVEAEEERAAGMEDEGEEVEVETEADDSVVAEEDDDDDEPFSTGVVPPLHAESRARVSAEVTMAEVLRIEKMRKWDRILDGSLRQRPARFWQSGSAGRRGMLSSALPPSLCGDRDL